MSILEASQTEPFASKWQLSDLSLLTETHSSWIWQVTAPSGPAVLKLIKPHAENELPGANLLRYWHGLGAARVFESENHAVLLEFLPGPSLGDLVRDGKDDEATRALAQVVRLLHRPRNFAPEGLTPLKAWLQPLLQSTHHGWPGHSLYDMKATASLARRLIDTSPGPFPLHGDLHHDNVLWSGSDWKAFDPKGLYGDPAYDIAQAFRNPAGAELLTRKYERIQFLAQTFSAELGYAQTRILGWAAVQTAISLIWQREVGKNYTDDLALLPRLLSAYATVNTDG